MKAVTKRIYICLILVVAMTFGMLVYLVRYFKDGDDWVSFPVNRHAYSDGVIALGKITDRNGIVLAEMSRNGITYNESLSIRKSTLHAVGDVEGNIGTGAIEYFATELMGYNPFTGVYSVSDKGNRLELTLDAEVNSKVLAAFEGRKGAAFLYNYKNGEVICMVSSPAFDPEDPPEEEQLSEEKYEGVYINRCISSTFTPGSIFKTVTLAAAISEIPDLFEIRFNCEGSIDVDGEIVNCNGVHGEIGIEEAFEKSCNVAFSELSLMLGESMISRSAENAGLTERMYLSKIPVAVGSYQAPKDKGDLAWSGIGQYKDLVNPIAMARFMGAIANEGKAVNPKIISGVKSNLGIPLYLGYSFSKSERLLNSNMSDEILKLMINNVKTGYSNYYGFGSIEGLAAKSGTAETLDGELPHAWFTGAIADDDNPYAFAVIVENAGWGLEQAGLVASVMMEAVIE